MHGQTDGLFWVDLYRLYNKNTGKNEENTQHFI